MITLYSGTPGSGKSLYASYLIYDRLIRNRPVIANFNIDFSVFGRKSAQAEKCYTWLDNSELSPQKLVDYAKNNHVTGKENQTTIIIDECSVLFNAREFGRKDRMPWIIFFQQHRKLGFNVILIAQNDRMIDRQIRSFIETEYKYRAIKHYKFFGRIVSFLSGGLFVRVSFWYGLHMKTGAEYFRLNRKKAKLYNTYEIFK